MANRASIMSRAWDIFRETYHYPRIKFASIGRDCFAWALRKAWAEAKDAARIAAIADADKQARITVLTHSIELENFNDCWPQASANVARMQAEISQLRGGAFHA